MALFIVWKRRFDVAMAFRLFLSLPFLAAFAGCDRSEMDAPKPAAQPIQVSVAHPHRGEVFRTIVLPSSRILPQQEATLYAKVAGYLKTINVDKGDEVSEGQLLAEIEVPELLADQAQFEAEVSVARTNYERLTQARQKAPDLVVPQSVDDLRGQWEIARAKLQRVQTLLNYAKITAPFSGTITARFVDPGAFIPAGSSGGTPQHAALLTLMDLHRVRVQVFVPEAEVPFIKNGLPVRLQFEGLTHRPFSATVTRFAHALDPATQTMLTEIEMPNPDGALRPGGFATVQLSVERKADALLVPVQALVTEKAGTFVFKHVEGKARKSAVRTGFNDGENVELLEGAAPDDTVLLLGKQAVTDGQAITVTEAK